MPVLLGENYAVATGLWGILFIFPYCSTNILYMYLTVHLKKKWRAIHAGVVEITHNRSIKLEDISQNGNKFEFDHKGMIPVEQPTEAKLDTHTANTESVLGRKPGNLQHRYFKKNLPDIPS